MLFVAEGVDYVRNAHALSRVCLNCTSRCYQQDCTRARRYPLPRKVKFFADCAVSFQRVSLTSWLAVLLWRRINIFRDIMRPWRSVLFFQLLRDLKLADEVPPWYIPWWSRSLYTRIAKYKYSVTLPCMQTTRKWEPIELTPV